jgi:hypothetical protein
MKKIYPLLVALVVFMFPFATYAAVNVTLRNDSTEAATGSVSIGIDTETDTLEKISLPIKYSGGLVLTDVTDGDVGCSDLNYIESQDSQDTIIVTCELDTPAALDGILANILFTSTGEPISFELIESEELDLGTLSLGDVVNFAQEASLTETPVTEDGATEQPLNEDLMVTTGTPTDSEKNNLLSSITEYLPYILIAGSVILLISIVVILLSKKKGPKTPKAPKIKKEKKGKLQQTTPIIENKEENQHSLKDMVNSAKSAPDQIAPEKTVSPQEQAPAPIPMSQATSQPSVQPTYTPPQQTTPITPNASQEEDLQEILQRESSVPTAMGDNTPTEIPQTEAPGVQEPNQEVPFSTGFAIPQQTNPESIMPEISQPQASPITGTQAPQEENPIQQPGVDQNLQENINGQINQINGGVIPTQEPPMETAQQPTQQEPQPQMPPIALQQNSNTDNTPEEMPPVPPTM